MNLIHRVSDMPFGSFGRLQSGDGRIDVVTVSCPWVSGDHHSGKPFESRIPNGAYQFIPHLSNTYGRCYILVSHGLSVGRSMDNDGSHRTDCLMHWGNWPTNYQGCFGVGEKLTMIEGKLGITNTKDTFNAVMATLNNENHYLSVVSGDPLMWEGYRYRTE